MQIIKKNHLFLKEPAMHEVALDITCHSDRLENPSYFV